MSGAFLPIFKKESFSQRGTFALPTPTINSVKILSAYSLGGTNLVITGTNLISSIPIISNLSVNGTTWTATTQGPHGLASGTVTIKGISGFATNSNLNGSRSITVTGPTTFTFTQGGSPGTGSYLGSSGLVELVGDGKPTVSFTQGSRVLNGKVVSSFSDSVIVRIPDFSIKITQASGSGTTINATPTTGLVAGMEVTTTGTQVANVTGAFFPGTTIQTVSSTSFTVNTAPSVLLSGATITAFNPSASITVTTSAGSSNSFLFNFFPNNYVDYNSVYDPDKDPAIAIAALKPGETWDGGGGVYFTKNITITQPCTVQNATIINPDYWIRLIPDECGTTAPSFAITAFTITSTSLGTNSWSNTATVTIDNSLGYVPGFGVNNIISIAGITTEFSNIALINDDHEITSVSSPSSTTQSIVFTFISTTQTTTNTIFTSGSTKLLSTSLKVVLFTSSDPTIVIDGSNPPAGMIPGLTVVGNGLPGKGRTSVKSLSTYFHTSTISGSLPQTYCAVELTTEESMTSIQIATSQTYFITPVPSASRFVNGSFFIRGLQPCNIPDGAYPGTVSSSGLKITGLTGAVLPNGFDITTASIYQIAPTPNNTSNYYFYVDGIDSVITAKCKNNNTIFDYGLPPQNGRIDSGASGIIGADTVFNKNIRASKIHHITWSPYDPSVIFDPDISETDLWSTVRGKHIPDGAYVGSINTTSLPKSFTLVNSGGGPLALEDVYDLPTIDLPFTIYIGGDQGALIVDILGTPQNTLTSPIVDPNIGPNDIGALVIGIALPPVVTPTATVYTSNLGIGYIDKISGGSFTVVSTNGKAINSSGAVYQVSVGGTIHPNVIGIVNSSTITDNSITNVDSGKLVVSNSTSSKGLPLGYVGPITAGTGNASPTFTLVSTIGGNTPVPIPKALTSIIVGGRIDGSSNDLSSNVMSTSANFLSCPTITSGDSGKLVRGINIPFPSYVDTPVNGSGFYLVDENKNAVSANNTLSQIYIVKEKFPLGSYIGAIDSSNSSFKLVDSNQNPVYLLADINNTNGTSVMVGPSQSHINLYNINAYGTSFASYYFYKSVAGYGFLLVSVDSVYVNSCKSRFVNGDCLAVWMNQSNSNFGNSSNIHVNTFWADNAGRCVVSVGAIDNRVDYNVFADLRVGNSSGLAGFDFESDLPFVGIGYLDFVRGNFISGFHLITSVLGPMNIIDCDMLGMFWYYDSLGAFKTKIIGGNYAPGIEGFGVYAAGATRIVGGDVEFKNVKIYRNKNYYRIMAPNGASSTQSSLGGYAESMVFKENGIDTIHNTIIQPGYRLGFRSILTVDTPAVYDPDISQALVDSWDAQNPTQIYTALDFVPQISGGGLIGNDVLTQVPSSPPTSDTTTYVNSVKILSLENTNNNNYTWIAKTGKRHTFMAGTYVYITDASNTTTYTNTASNVNFNGRWDIVSVPTNDSFTFNISNSAGSGTYSGINTLPLANAKIPVSRSNFITQPVIQPSFANPVTLPLWYETQNGGWSGIGLGKVIIDSTGATITPFYQIAAVPYAIISSVSIVGQTTNSVLLTFSIPQLSGFINVGNLVYITGLYKTAAIPDMTYVVTAITVSSTNIVSFNITYPNAKNANVVSGYVIVGSSIATGPITISSMTKAATGNVWTVTTQSPHGLSTGAAIIRGVTGFQTNGNINGVRSITVAANVTNTFTVNLTPSPGTGTYTGSLGKVDGALTTDYKTGDIVSGVNIPIGSYVDTGITNDGTYNTQFNLVDGNGNPVVPSGPLNTIYFGDFYSFLSTNYPTTGSTTTLKTTNARFSHVPYMLGPQRTHTVTGDGSSSVIKDSSIVDNVVHTVTGDSSQSRIYDPAITTNHQGHYVSGLNIPLYSYVGPVDLSTTLNNVTTPSFLLVDNTSAPANVLPLGKVEIISITGDTGTMVSGSGIPVNSYVGKVNLDLNKNPVSFDLVDYDGFPTKPLSALTSVTLGGGMITSELQPGLRYAATQTKQAESASLHKNVSGFSVITNKRSVNVYKNTITLTASSVISTTDPTYIIVVPDITQIYTGQGVTGVGITNSTPGQTGVATVISVNPTNNQVTLKPGLGNTIGTLTQSSYSFIDIVDASISKGNAREVHANYKTGGSVTVSGVVVDESNNQIALTVNSIQNIGLGSTMSSADNTTMNAAPIIDIDAINNIVYVQISYQKTTIDSQQATTTTNFTAITDVSLITTGSSYNVASNYDGMIMDSFVTVNDVGSIVSGSDLPSAISDLVIDTVNIATAPNCNSFTIIDSDGNIAIPTGPTLQIFIGGHVDSVTTSVDTITGKWNNVITDLNLNSGIVHNLTVTANSSEVLDTLIDSTDEGSLIWVSPNGPIGDTDLDSSNANNNLSVITDSLGAPITDSNGNLEIVPIIPSVEYVKTWSNANKPLSNWGNVYVGPVDPGVSFIMVDSKGIPVEPNLSAITDISTNQGLFADGIVPITAMIGGDMYKSVADFGTVIPDPAFIKMNPLVSPGTTTFALVDVNYNDITITGAITKVAIGARIDNFYGNINDTKIYDSSVTIQDIGSKIQGPYIPLGAVIGKPVVSNSYFTLIDHSNLNLHLINNVNSAVVADDTGALVSSDYTDTGTFVGTIRTDLDPPRFAPVFYNGDASLPKDNLTSVIIGGRSDIVSSANGNSFIVDGAVSTGRNDLVSLVNKSNGKLINDGNLINIATMAQTTASYNVTITPTTSLGTVNATNYPWIAGDMVYISGVSAWGGNTVWNYAIPDGYYSIVSPSAGTFKISTTRQITPVWVSNNPTGSSTLKITSANAALITTSYTILELTASAITNISNVDADGNCTITLNQNYTLSSSIAYYTFTPPLPVSNVSYTISTNQPSITPATNTISNANITVADKGKTALLLSGTDPNGSQPSSYTDAYRVATPITTTLQALVNSVAVSSGTSVITLTVQAWPVISGVSTPFVAGTRVLISSDIKNGAVTLLAANSYHNITTVSGTTFTISDVTGLSSTSSISCLVTVTVAGSFVLQDKYGANVNLKGLPSNSGNFYVQIGSDKSLQVIDRDSYLLDVSYPSRPVYVGTITGNGFNLVNNNQQSIPAQGAISSLMVLSGRSDSGAYSPFLLASGKSLSLNNGASTAINDLTNYGTTYMVNPHPSIAGDAGQLISRSGIPYGTTIDSIKTSATTATGSPIGYANTYVLALSGINISNIIRGTTAGQITTVTITARGTWATGQYAKIYGLGKYGIPDSNYSISSGTAGSFTVSVHLSSDAALPSGTTSVSGLIPAMNITKIANVVVYGSSWKVNLYLNDIGVPWAVNQAVYIRGLSSKNIPDGLYTITATGSTAAPSSPVGNFFTINVGNAAPIVSNNVTGFVTVGMGFWDTTSTDWLVKNKVNVGGRIDSFGNDGTSSTILDTQITTGDTGSTVWIANMPNVIGPDAYYFVGNVTSGMIGVSFPLVDGSGNPVIPKNSFSGILVGGRNDGVKVSFGSNNPTIVYDTKIKTSDAGSLVTGPYIPPYSFVGTVTYPSFALVDGSGTPVSLSQSPTNINIISGKTYIKDKYITLKDIGSYVTGKNIPSNGSYAIGRIVNRFELLDNNNVFPVTPLGEVTKSYLYNPSTHFTRTDNISIIEDNRVDKVTWSYLTHSINDTNISIYDFGKYVNGANIPPDSYVGSVTSGASFVLVDSTGAPVGPGFNITAPFNIIIGTEASNIISNINSVASDRGSIITGYNVPGRTDTVTWPRAGNILNQAIGSADVGLPIAQINVPINASSIIPGGIFLAESASSPNNGPFVLTFYDVSSIKVDQPVTGPGISGYARVATVDTAYGKVTLIPIGTNISTGGLSTSVYNFVGAKVGTVSPNTSFTLVDMLDNPLAPLDSAYGSNKFDIVVGYSTVGEIGKSFELLDSNRNNVYFDSYNHLNDIDLWIDNGARAVLSYNYTTDDPTGLGFVVLHEVSYRGVQSPELRQLRNGGPLINDPTNVPPVGAILPDLTPNLLANAGTQGALLTFTDCIFDESAGPGGNNNITKFGAIAANDPSSVSITQSVTKITVPVITITGVSFNSSIATLTGTIPSIFDINYWKSINSIYIKGLSTYSIPDGYYTITTGTVSLNSLTVTFTLSDNIATANATNTGISNATGTAVMLNSIGNWPINTAISISGLQTTTPSTNIPDGDYTIDSSMQFNIVATDASSIPGGAHTLTFSDISKISLDQVVIGMGILGYARIGNIAAGTTVNGITPGVVSLIGDKIRYLLPNSYKFISGFFVVPLNTATINLSSVQTTTDSVVTGSVIALQVGTANGL